MRRLLACGAALLVAGLVTTGCPDSRTTTPEPKPAASTPAAAGEVAKTAIAKIAVTGMT